MEKALRVKQSNLGSNHPDLVPDLLSLANLLMSLVSAFASVLPSVVEIRKGRTSVRSLVACGRSLSFFLVDESTLVFCS